jgi:hypothetical protein
MMALSVTSASPFQPDATAFRGCIDVRCGEIERFDDVDVARVAHGEQHIQPSARHAA